MSNLRNLVAAVTALQNDKNLCSKWLSATQVVSCINNCMFTDNDNAVSTLNTAMSKHLSNLNVFFTNNTIGIYQHKSRLKSVDGKILRATFYYLIYAPDINNHQPPTTKDINWQLIYNKGIATNAVNNAAAVTAADNAAVTAANDAAVTAANAAAVTAVNAAAATVDADADAATATADAAAAATNAATDTATAAADILLQLAGVERCNKRQRLLDTIGSYWLSGEATNLFYNKKCSEKKDMQVVLYEVIELFDNILNHKCNIDIVVNKANKQKLTYQQYDTCRQKVCYLRQAYLNAVEFMPGKSWLYCCQDAVDSINHYTGYCLITSGRVLQQWHRYFRQQMMLPHPNRYIENDVKVEPRFFMIFPEAWDMIKQYLKGVSPSELRIDKLYTHIHTIIIPKMIVQLRSELPTEEQSTVTKEYMMKLCNLTALSPSTILRWISRLGFTYGYNLKCYFTDGHEHPEVVERRREFIDTYLEMEKQSYRWIQVTEAFALQLESEYPFDPTQVELATIPEGSYYRYQEDNNVWMREYHVDSHPVFSLLLSEPAKAMGGNLSVRLDRSKRPLLIIGQDEAIISQYIFGRRTWIAPNGRRTLFPKSDGDRIMISTFMSRFMGFATNLSSEQVQVINDYRQSVSPQYVAADAATEVLASTVKPKLDANTFWSPICQLLDLGKDRGTFWDYQKCVLQIEDVVDCVCALYPGHDVVLLVDQSSGHMKSDNDALNANAMNATSGGSQRLMRDTVMSDGCLGPFTHEFKLKLYETQSMTFMEDDRGPFHLLDKDRIKTKYDVATAEVIDKKKNKSELLKDIKEKGVEVKKYLPMNELIQIANNINVSISKSVPVLSQQGWVGTPKGLRQVLWERGWLDPKQKVSNYTLKYTAAQLDADGNITDVGRRFNMKYIMSQCSDFKEQETALQNLCREKLSAIHQVNVTVLPTPKYHCELAGEGIEYAWGHMKQKYRNLSLMQKQTKKLFLKSVEESLQSVRKISAQLYNARARRYMLAYKVIDHRKVQAVQENAEKPEITHMLIEKLVRKQTSHRSVMMFDAAFISKAQADMLNS